MPKPPAAARAGVHYDVVAAHLQAHLAQPYIEDFLSQRHTLLDGEMEVRWLRMASPYQN